MKATLSFFVLLPVLTVSLANANIYRCEDTDGTRIFTDNLSNIPQGCQTDIVRDLPRSDVPPSNLSPPVKQRTAPQLPTSESRQKQPKHGEVSYHVLKAGAESLVEHYLSTRKNVFRFRNSSDRRRARIELADIRAQKSRLLNEINKSTLRRAKKAEVNLILSTITE